MEGTVYIFPMAKTVLVRNAGAAYMYSAYTVPNNRALSYVERNESFGVNVPSPHGEAPQALKRSKAAFKMYVSSSSMTKTCAREHSITCLMN